MTTFSILTRGCKVNQYESQQIRALLESYGLTAADVTQLPDLVVVNTCCVTHTAAGKSRQLARQAKRLEPRAVVVCGCAATVAADEFENIGPNVRVVKNRCDLAATLRSLVTDPTTPNPPAPPRPGVTLIEPQIDSKVKPKNDLGPPEGLPPLSSFQGQTRAFLKIQDGCDACCSYCIIPQARPKVHSKPPDKVLAEANALVASGHKEIVLTGVHVGAYGCASVRRRERTFGPDANLPDLLEKVARIRGLARVRVSSLDPADVTPRLLEVFASHRNIMPHLHLSLQSGSDSVLRRMCRPYTADDFRAKVELVRNHLDRPAITTDIIVGFPGETQTDFDQTRALAEEVAFAKIHVFAFSPRQGTAAARMQDKLPPQVTKQRSRILRDLDLDLQRRFRDRFIGETAQVLIETANGSPAGRAERYFMVRVAADPDQAKRPHNNTLVNVTITENAPDAVLATLS